jgi:hypothetical protein
VGDRVAAGGSQACAPPAGEQEGRAGRHHVGDGRQDRHHAGQPGVVLQVPGRGGGRQSPVQHLGAQAHEPVRAQARDPAGPRAGTNAMAELTCKGSG